MGAVGSGSGGEGWGSSFAVDLGGGGPLSGEVLAGRRGRGGAGRGGADLVAGGAKITGRRGWGKNILKKLWWC
jgi:hypothetical protein